MSAYVPRSLSHSESLQNRKSKFFEPVTYPWTRSENSWASFNKYIYCSVKGQWVHLRAWKTHEFLHSVGVRTSVSLWVQTQRGYVLVWVDGKLDPCEILMPLSGWNLSGSGWKSLGSGWKSFRPGCESLGSGWNLEAVRVNAFISWILSKKSAMSL